MCSCESECVYENRKGLTVGEGNRAHMKESAQGLLGKKDKSGGGGGQMGKRR